MKHLVTLCLLLIAASVYAAPQPDCLAPKPKAKVVKHHAHKKLTPLVCEAQPVIPLAWAAPPVIEPPIAPLPAAPSIAPPDVSPAALLPPEPMFYPQSWYEPMFSDFGGTAWSMPPSLQYTITQNKVSNSYSDSVTTYDNASIVVSDTVTNVNSKTITVSSLARVRPQKAPELDASSSGAAATLLIGLALVMNGRKPRS